MLTYTINAYEATNIITHILHKHTWVLWTNKSPHLRFTKICYLLGWRKTHIRYKHYWPQYLKVRERQVRLWSAQHRRTVFTLAVFEATSSEEQDYRQSLPGQATVFPFPFSFNLEKVPFRGLPRNMPQVSLFPKFKRQESLVYWRQKNVLRN